MVVGTFLFQYRVVNGLTQADLAEKLSISQNTVSQYETGQRTPTVKQAARILAALGCSIDEIMPDRKGATSMPQVEKIRGTSPPPAPWPEPWPDTVPPAWYYPPSWWPAPPAEAPPARHGQAKDLTYGGKASVPSAPDRDDGRQHMVCLPAVLNVHQAAEYLSVCDEVVYTLVHREDFPGFRIGRIWRIDAQRLGEWVSRQQTKRTGRRTS